MRIIKSCWVNTPSFRSISERFDVPFNELAFLLEDYIKTSQYEVFSLRMDNLFGTYSSFAKQEIIAELNECIEELHFIDAEDGTENNRKSVKVVENRALIYIKDS